MEKDLERERAKWSGKGNAIVVFELDNIAGPVTSIMNLFQHGTVQRVAGNLLLLPLLAFVSPKIAH